MQIYNSFFLTVLALVTCLPILVSCGTLQGQKTYFVPKDQGETPISLRLNPQVGNTTVTDYHSHSHVEVFQDQQILRERDEIVDFSVQDQIEAVHLDGQSFSQRVKILKKDGHVDLHSLGFPEENEELLMTLSLKAEVIRAGDYPKNSIFFVPPISLPKNPVAIGETWVLDKEWVSQANGIPLKLELVSVLKGVYQCDGDPEGCADIEISGMVKMMGLNQKKVQFQSEVRGRHFFALSKGLMLWSVVKGQESLMTETNLLKVRSCMSLRIQNSELAPTGSLPIKCEPVYDMPTVPGT